MKNFIIPTRGKKSHSKEAQTIYHYYDRKDNPYVEIDLGEPNVVDGNVERREKLV